MIVAAGRGSRLHGWIVFIQNMQLIREFGFVRALIKFERKLTRWARFVPSFRPKTGLNGRNLPFIYDKFAANAEISHCSPVLGACRGTPKGVVDATSWRATRRVSRLVC